MLNQFTFPFRQFLFLGINTCFIIQAQSTELCSFPRKNTQESTFEEAEFKPDSLEYQTVESDALSPELKTLEARFTPSSLAYEGVASEASAKALMGTMGRYLGYAGKGLAVVGPIFDAVALAQWTQKIVDTIKDKDHNGYDDIATSLYLVPIASNIADIVAHTSHLKEQIQQQTEALNALHQYSNIDNNNLATHYTWRIREALKAIDQSNQDIAFKINRHFDHSRYQAMAWYHQFATQETRQLERHLQRLEIQYFKHIYHELYQAPYQLERHHNLPYYPAECDNTLLSSQLSHEQAETLRKNLNHCRDEVNAAHLQPLIDLFQDQHPNFTIEQWIAQTKALQNAKQSLINMRLQKLKRTRTALEQRLQASFQNYIQQLNANPTLHQHNMVQTNLFKQILLRHYIANEFPDIPLEQIHLNLDDISFTVTHEAACSSHFRASFFYKIPGIYATCQLMEEVSNLLTKPILVKLDPSKSTYWQAYQQKAQQQLSLLSAKSQLSNQSQSFVFKRSHTQNFHQYYINQFDELLEICQRYDRVFVDIDYDCQRFLNGNTITSHSQALAKSLPQIGLMLANTLKLKKNNPSLFEAYKNTAFKHGTVDELVQRSIKSLKTQPMSARLSPDQYYPGFNKYLRLELMHDDSDYLSQQWPILPKKLINSIHPKRMQSNQRAFVQLLKHPTKQNIEHILQRALESHQKISFMQGNSFDVAQKLFAWQAILRPILLSNARYNMKLARAKHNVPNEHP